MGIVQRVISLSRQRDKDAFCLSRDLIGINRLFKLFQHLDRRAVRRKSYRTKGVEGCDQADTSRSRARAGTKKDRPRPGFGK